MKLFRKVYKLTAFLIPFKNLKLKYKDCCFYLDLNKNIKAVQNNYKRTIERIQNKPKDEKIKVIFLIRENQKWTYQSVYEELEKDKRFEPLVVVSILELARIGKDKTRNNLKENYNFFKTKNINVEYALKNGNYVDLKEFNPDIVFYDQPWDLPEIHKPEYVSEFALTCYSPYGYELLEKREAYTQDFHSFLYRYYIEHELNLKRYISYMKENANNCVVVGYPKLDKEYENPQENIFKHKTKFKIIYAPHHSLEKKGLNISTFRTFGKVMLELAKNNPKTTWIFKPHPRFKYALLRNKIMTEKEVEQYYNEWEKVGKIIETGNYFGALQQSNLMITDCCSFLAEYLKTKKPLIRLVNKKGMQLNPIGKKIEECYYPVLNIKELEDVFNKITKDKKDEKLAKREKVKEELFDSKISSASKIMEDIINTLDIEKGVTL